MERQERVELLEAFRLASTTVEPPGNDELPSLDIAFARLRADAEVFPGPSRRERSLASLDEGTLVLRVGDKIANARRMIFAPAVNFGFVGAALVVDMTE